MSVLSPAPSPNVFRAYSGQEETLVNEEPNKAGPGLVPPVCGLSVRAALLACVCCVWKNRKGQGVVSTYLTVRKCRQPALWSGSALCLVCWGDKRWVKIRKSKFMGDKTSLLSQLTTGHVGDHDPCVQNPESPSFSVSYLVIHDFCCLVLYTSAVLLE